MAGGGAIEAILPRTNLIYRSDAFKEKLIAANVTLVIGVVAPDLPADFELIDRWSVAAEAEGCRFLLVANKADLPDAQRLVERLSPWRALGLHGAADVREARRRAAEGSCAGRAQRSRRAIRHGQEHDAERASARRRGAYRGNLRGPCDRTAHDDRDDAPSDSGRPASRLDRRLAGNEGVRPRASRSACDRGGVRRDPSVARPMSLPGLPARPRARVCGAGSGRSAARSHRIALRFCTRW